MLLIYTHYLFDPLSEWGGGGDEESDVKVQTCILTTNIYGVATIGRLLKMTGLFCRISFLL